MNATVLTTNRRCAHGHFMTRTAPACHCGQPAATTPDTTQRPRLSLVKTIPDRPALPRRLHPNGLLGLDLSTLRYGISETSACRAALAARTAGLGGHVRVMDWTGHPDGTATAPLAGGAMLRYQPHPRLPLAVTVPCLLGAHHHRSIHSLLDLADVYLEADTCLTAHADFTGWPTIAARDLSAAFAGHPTTSTIRVQPLHTKDTTTDA